MRNHPNRFRLFIFTLSGLVLLPTFYGLGEAFNRRTPVVVAVEKVGPAVVNIYTQEKARSLRNPFRNFGDGLFDEFFNQFLVKPREGRRSLGSGVIINSEGYILTNEHVVSRAEKIKVTLIDKREFDAQFIGADMKSDLAIIKIESDARLPFVEMGRSNDLMPGETVLAIGNPFGLQHTVTTGIISALNRTLQTDEKTVYQDFIQLDASINPGNSGGPLVNINGELIGINTAIFQKAEGIGFAIPIDKAHRIVKDLMEFGKVRPGWVGLSVQDLNPDLTSYFGLNHPHGVLVTRVFEDSPASKAGIKRGDLLLSLEGKEIENRLSFWGRVASYPVGNAVTLNLKRKGETRAVRLTIRLLPDDRLERYAQEYLGISVKPITQRVARRFGLHASRGVLIDRVVPSSPAGKIGIRPGDVILQVDQRRVNRMEDFHQALRETGMRDSVLLRVLRGRYGYYVTLEP